MKDSMWVHDDNAPSTSSSLPSRDPDPVSCRSSSRHSDNVYNLLALREITPQRKRSTKRLWRGNCDDSRGHIFELGRDAKRGIFSWVEAESFRCLSAKYCPLMPPPRSTIAAAFSPSGKTLASTHGDHTVKIIDWQTGNCLKVLSGHRRTPWVVRYHPTCLNLLASGSLDHEVRLWDANTGECIGSKDFYRPVASMAFHAQGELLAVASGHKLYIWHYNRSGEASAPKIVLKTRRSLRAVHFHPHAAPFLLTAEVNDVDSSDSSMTLSTSQGYVRYPPPNIYFANAHSNDHPSLADPLMSHPFLFWPSLFRDDGRISLQHSDRNAGLTGTQTQQSAAPAASVRPDSSSTDAEPPAPELTVDELETSDGQSGERYTQLFPFGDAVYWDLPFLQGWLMGQSQAGQRITRAVDASGLESSPVQVETSNQEPVALSATQIGSRHQPSRFRTTATALSTEGTAIPQDESDPVTRIQSELASSLAAAAAAELPCTVKLRIWPFDIKDPCVCLPATKCRLIIPYAVLCSEMGAHFSPCGRFLAACVACMLPNVDGEPGIHMQAHNDAAEAATSPTRHPITAHQVMYELRIYSLEESTFGLVLASRAIRAAHCLTSIQFSPTSEHLLLAYGRRHSSLLKSVVIDGEMSVPIYTILEVYRVSDMELVRVLPSVEDEVNVACFHPLPGGGLVYGTKEGKLRILQYDSSNRMSCMPNCFFDENLLEVTRMSSTAGYS